MSAVIYTGLLIKLIQIIIELMNLDVSDTIPKASIDDLDDESGTGASSPVRGEGPPSETSSQEWDKMTDSEPGLGRS